MTPPAESVARAIRERRSFIVTSHARPDGDAVGSSLALALALDALGKETRVLLHDPVPAPYVDFPHLARIERVDHVSGSADATVVLECSDLSRPEIAGLADGFIINIDHHVGNGAYGSVNWFDGTAAACGEMVADLIDALGVPWTPAIAEHLYLAVSTDTGGLRYGLLSPRTYELCRRVAALGVDTARLSRRIFENYSIGRIRVTGAMLAGMTLHHGDRLAVLSLDEDLLARTGATLDDTEGLVNLPLAARDVVVVALVKRQSDDLFRVSLRSKGAVDVRAVAAGWGGGGHQNAAGCTLRGPEADVRRALVDALGRAVGVPAS